jgi:hypothetical protein
LTIRLNMMFEYPRRQTHQETLIQTRELQ